MNLIEGINNTIINTKGSKYYNTSYNYNLDLFCSVSRYDNEDKIITNFNNALSENETLALANLLYILDIRNGKGERRIFKIIFKYLCENKPLFAIKILPFISELGRYDYIKRSDSVAAYFSKFRYEEDYEYKITKQVGINAWNIIFNSKSKFVSEAIRAKNTFIKNMQDHKNIEPYYNEENDNTISDSEIKHMAQVATQACKEEISVYRDYLKTCAKVLKAIIDHGGDSKYKKNENNDE